MDLMAERKPNRRPAKGAKKTPAARKELGYIAVPLAWYAELKRIAVEQERSISWVGRQAVRKYLESLGRLPPPGPAADGD